MLEGLFWACAFLLAYHYFLYPGLVIAFSRLRPAPAPPDPAEWPSVSVIIAAYNEERVIDWKIRNTLGLDYPKDRFEVIVASDGSNDRTAEIARSFVPQGVVSLHEPARRGKTAALNRGVRQARGEIVVFSDANNEFSPDAIRRLVRHFGDPSVGGVCGAKRIKPAAERESSAGDSLFWRYESAIKVAESRIGTINNADGEIFALRRSLYKPVPEHIINDDAEITLDLIEQGKRIVYEPGAHSSEYASIHIRDDFFVKVRMVAGGYQTLAENPGALFPLRSWFAWSFFSHKTLRWLAPVFLIGTFAASVALAAQPLYLAALLAQVGFYALAALGWLLIGRVKSLPALLYVPFYFTTMNLAAFRGLLRFLRRSQTVHWRRAQR
jgi:cellulose synthase/poly-beta-1,6-N-acetylglucosamine synthase-like glycosyltransferase